MDTTAIEKTVRVSKKFPESIARVLQSSKPEELKEMMVTENGFTIAEEERMLREEQEDLDRGEEEGFKSPEETIGDLKNIMTRNEKG